MTGLNKTLIQRLRDTAQMKTQFPPWLLAELENAANSLAEQEAEIARLRGFANDVMEVWPEGDLDGGSLQDFAVKHGLLRTEMRDGPCGEGCGCSEFLGEEDWPSECFRRTPLLTGLAQHPPTTPPCADAIAATAKGET